MNAKLEEFNEKLSKSKVAVLGVGVSNRPLIEYLHNLGSNTTILEAKEKEKCDSDIVNMIDEYGMEAHYGEDYLSYLKGYDVIFRSPSILPTVKELAEEAKRGALVTTEIEMLLKLAPCKITIGITGSDGKTTTTTLTAKVLEDAGYKVFLGGNIGTPLFTKINEMSEEDILVLEMSSFQLMGMDISPKISIVTNVTPNHLNIHKDMEEYIESKANIFKYQDENDKVILNYNNDVTYDRYSKMAKSKVVLFSGFDHLDNGYYVENNTVYYSKDGVSERLISIDEMIIKGNHNLQNACCVYAATEGLVSKEKATETIKSFGGVHHRQELVRVLDGVTWINDSSSSTPTRTMTGLKAYAEEGLDVENKHKKIILIAGGYDKNLDNSVMAKPISNTCKALVLIGQIAEKIEKAVRDVDTSIPIYREKTLEDAINRSKKIATEGDIVLLSPAAASFDMFNDAYHRGDCFKEIVNNL